MTARQPVGVVTGGGGGIGAAIAEEIGRGGWFVVTVDPLVTLDGSDRPRAPRDHRRSHRGSGWHGHRLVGIGHRQSRGRALFRELIDEHGALDAVVNVAGITRHTGFAEGTAEEWRAVLGVHLGGFLNVLDAALPLMAAEGHGSILGVTSGSGWRAADAGAYSCAKRAIAALAWQLGRQTPPGVTVNAISPIAATRMVAAAVERARGSRRPSGGAAVSRLESVPRPEDLAPFGAYLVDDRFRWCSGRVLFAGGSEIAVVEEPRLLEVVRSDDVAASPGCSRPSSPERSPRPRPARSSGGGGNPRFGPIFEGPAPPRRRIGARAIRVSSSPTVHDWRPRSPPPSRPGPSCATT